MCCRFLLLFAIFCGYPNLGLGSPQNDQGYQVVGVPCAVNEEVSCMIVKCPAGRFCPAENYCYNPRCVCRRGYRRSHGVCVQKHVTLNLDAEALNSALLQTRFR
ncbi:cysteine-rich with EGF-like domain protein 1 [Drosophila novamexicana]|uniref:cysteine-rich with EGF-like domain protein 1 n=1 Tax=Drosophila novamexicana TaxID=47314 RepID=UPI0011E5A686|nr:cysteine-rich with EGF-like domain protein 1 [Drosophila novamexicana]